MWCKSGALVRAVVAFCAIEDFTDDDALSMEENNREMIKLKVNNVRF